MTPEQDKVICEECGWRGRVNELLQANHPFDPNDTAMGCPRCKSIDLCVSLCDEPGCQRKVACGFPVEGGYRNTCGDHYREWLRSQEKPATSGQSQV